MPATGVSRAQENKAIRQDALRKQLASQGHVEHVIEIIDKVKDLNNKLDATELNRYKFVVETKLKLIGKYLPDLKQSEVSTTVNGDINLQLIQVEYIASDKDTDS